MGLLPVLTIAGSDSSGGAGIQADLKAFTALRTYGMTVITALTAQNTQGVWDVHTLPPSFVEAQLKAVFEDISPRAIKTGMLAETEIIMVVERFLRERAAGIPLVVDPVLVATSGARLLSEGSEAAMRAFAAQAFLVTPNLPEAALLAEMPVPEDESGFFELGKALSQRFPTPYWLIKGGHAVWERHTVTSLLFQNGRLVQRFVQPRLALPRPPHGTGCTLASAIAAYLARGASAIEAAQAGLDFVHQALRAADFLLGKAAIVPNPSFS